MTECAPDVPGETFKDPQMIRLSPRGRRMPAVAVAVLALSGCATTMTDSGDSADPWEPVNRKTYALNDTLDRALLAPVSRLYLKLPGGLRDRVGNFFDNAAYPGTAVNQLLQGKFGLAMEDSMRFVVNSTLGIAGLFDVSTGLGLERHEEDFGQTLGVWGLEAGNFVNLPFFGPSSVRDVSGSVADLFTNVTLYLSLPTLPITALYAVNRRAELTDAIEVRDQALDPYVFTREAYRQRREFLIHDANPPLDAFDDEDEDDEDGQVE